jgi:hypothetical protein
MTQPVTSLDSWLVTVVLATLAISLPILAVLAIRFFWDRSLSIGRSKELEKLIWQLHRIASAMEHQMNLSFPAVQPGTEEASDIAFLQQRVAPVKAPSPSVAPNAAAAATGEPAAQQPTGAEPGTQNTGFPPLVPRDPSAEPPRQGGVNSMFGF